MKKKGINIVVAGHICLDMFPEFLDTTNVSFRELFVPGKLTNVGGMRISTGGSVSNTGIAMQVLGANVSLVAKIGDDFIGEAILQFLKKRGSAEGIKGIKIIKGESSSYTVAIAPKGVDRMFLHNPGTNDTFGYEDIDFELVKKARLFYLGYPPLMKRLYEDGGEQLVRIYRKAYHLGVVTALDFSLPDPEGPSGEVNWKEILKAVLPYVDIFLPSVEEVQFILDKGKFLRMREETKGKELVHLFDEKHLAQMSNTLSAYGTKIVGIKCGSRGFYIKTASKEKMEKIDNIDLNNWSDRQLWAPSYRIEKFVSAAGSGDSSIAGFIVAFLRGETIEKSLEYACMCGAQNVQVLDSVSGVKNWEQTTSDIRSGWSINDLKVVSKGWNYNKKENLWYGPEDKEAGKVFHE